MQRAVAAERRLADTTNRCWYCFKSPSIRKHLIIALGEHSLLMLPPKGSKMPGHCIIVPQDVRSVGIVWPGVCVHVCVCARVRVTSTVCTLLQHTPSMTAANENVYDEVNMFKGALHKMFAAQDKDVIFLETAIQLHRRPHAVVEAVPVTKEAGMDAPIYFKKALQEIEEWTTHKKIINTAGKGLRKCVPEVRAVFNAPCVLAYH